MLWAGQTSPVAAEATLLTKTLSARPLPSSALRDSPDLVQGSVTLRLGDAGEQQWTMPNACASDGVLWRQRFSPVGHLQFLEAYRDNELDQVAVIDTTAPDSQQVTVHGQDAWFLLKKAYERDWTVVQSPRDVIERATQVWVPVTVDGFPAGTLNSQWIPTQSGPSSNYGIGPSGGLTLNAPNIADTSSVQTNPVSFTQPSGIWRAEVTVTSVTGEANVSLILLESDTNIIELAIGASGSGISADFSYAGTNINVSQVTSSPGYTLLLESDGEWIWAFVNQQLIGCCRRVSATTASLVTDLQVVELSTATISAVLVEAQIPFIGGGTDKGDYALSGGPSTFPNGGLHARYFNNADLQGLTATQQLSIIHSPPRTNAYAGSGVSEYQNQQDPQINGQANPTPGATIWSAIWFGAIWLKLSAGNYTFTIKVPSGVTDNYAVRAWIGKTVLGTQLLDAWSFTNTSGQTFTFTVSAAALAGTLSYGGGTVQRDGWYPIKVEYAVEVPAVGAAAPTFRLTNSPAAYTDPGGTAIASGAQSTVVPATSLSPLGCVDQRYQGISHFDLAQQTVQAFGYQASVEPYALETLNESNQPGYFPGQLAPRIREGHDVDVVLKPNIGPSTDGEGLLNYSSTLDATDFADSLQGNGAGLQNGTNGQLQTNVYDPATMLDSLFDVQAWQDFSDAAFPELLDALLNSQLGLQLEPWQLLSADPVGRPRQAFTWPLPGTLAKMRWRPGDGLLIDAPEINVVDLVPRQILVITRNILPLGISSTTATFANRPKNAANTLKKQLYTVSRLQRNYQRQTDTLSGNYVSGTINPGLTGAPSSIAVQQSDQIVLIQLRVTVNNGLVSFGVVVNGVDETSILGGPWLDVPITLNIASAGAVSSNNNLTVAVTNRSGATASDIEYQLFATVLR